MQHDGGSHDEKSTTLLDSRSSFATTIPPTSPERQASRAASSPGRFMFFPLSTSISIRASSQPRRWHSARISFR